MAGVRLTAASPFETLVLALCTPPAPRIIGSRATNEGVCAAKHEAYGYRGHGQKGNVLNWGGTHIYQTMSNPQLLLSTRVLKVTPRVVVLCKPPGLAFHAKDGPGIMTAVQARPVLPAQCSPDTRV